MSPQCSCKGAHRLGWPPKGPSPRTWSTATLELSHIYLQAANYTEHLPDLPGVHTLKYINIYKTILGKESHLGNKRPADCSDANTEDREKTGEIDKYYFIWRSEADNQILNHHSTNSYQGWTRLHINFIKVMLRTLNYRPMVISCSLR